MHVHDHLEASPEILVRTNWRFHRQVHLASHNRYLVQQLDLVHRSMALMETTTLAITGRSEVAFDEHRAVLRAITARDEDGAYQALRDHISNAFVARLKIEAIRVDQA